MEPLSSLLRRLKAKSDDAGKQLTCFNYIGPTGKSPQKFLGGKGLGKIVMARNGAM